MPDYSKPPISFAEALRSWASEDLEDAVDDRQFGEAVRAELERRKRACTCILGHPPKRDCPRHQGRRP
jgi:hypothetical protein